MTNYLFDTSVFLWSVAAPERLNKRAQQLLENPREALFFSAASAWEISIKSSSGKLRLPEPASAYVPKRLISRAIRVLPITHTHSLAAGELPGHHSDPFDRMLIAQAQLEGFTLLTADRAFEQYQADLFWCGR